MSILKKKFDKKSKSFKNYKMSGTKVNNNVNLNVKKKLPKKRIDRKPGVIYYFEGRKMMVSGGTLRYLCKEEGCNVRARYNNPGEKIGFYCSKHKEKSMIDIEKKTCTEEGCYIFPNFNYKGKKKGSYCFTHKKEGMVDVTHKTCYENGCNSRPNFNYKGKKKGLYCSSHKKKNMVDVTHKTCKKEGCDTQPNFNYKGKKKDYIV